MTLAAISAACACRPSAEDRLRNSTIGQFAPLILGQYTETSRQIGPLPECGRVGIRRCNGAVACEVGAVPTPENFCVADTSPELTANLALCGGNGEPCCPGTTPHCVREDLCTGPGNALACRDGGVCDASGFCRPRRGACDHTTCGACTADRNCGWCKATNTCLEGRLTGPTNGSCGTQDDWEYGQNACTSDTCVAVECGSCVQQRECGWCGNDIAGTCRPGDSTAPRAGACAGGFWRGDARACEETRTLETECQPLGSACTSNVECCDRASCRTRASSPGALGCCQEKGQACQTGSDCCGTLICGASGRCEGVADGAECLNTRDCRTGLCWNGRCNVSSEPDMPDLADPGSVTAPRPTEPQQPRPNRPGTPDVELPAVPPFESDLNRRG